jgi:hypothetical protein
MEILKAITRFDYEYPATPGRSSRKLHGWYVRVVFRGTMYRTKYFSDKKYGGKLKSKKAAILYRDTTHAQIHKPVIASPVVTMSHTNTNFQGVRRVISKEYKRNKLYVREVFEVTAPSVAGSKVKRTSIGIKTHGYEKALALAVLKYMEFAKERYDNA